jgi:hypothetical protein
LTSLESKEKKAENTVSSVKRYAKSSGWLKIRAPTTKTGKTLLTKKHGKESKRGGSKGLSLPPPLQVVVSMHHTFRFTVTTAVTGTAVAIDGGGVCGALGGICTVVNSVVTCYASSFRIKRISVWPSAVAVGTSAPNPEIVWYSPSNAIEKDSSVQRSLPSGITVCAPVHSRPPRGSLCGDWLNSVVNVTNPLFGFFYVPLGSVIDMECSWTMANNLQAMDRTVATGILKGPYYLPLDGTTRHGIQPANMPTTF